MVLVRERGKIYDVYPHLYSQRERGSVNVCMCVLAHGIVTNGLNISLSSRKGITHLNSELGEFKFALSPFLSNLIFGCYCARHTYILNGKSCGPYIILWTFVTFFFYRFISRKLYSVDETLHSIFSVEKLDK